MTFDTRSLEGGGQVLVPTALEAAGFLALFTERSGGVSQGPFASLNLSYSTADSPEAVAANRERVLASLDLPPFALGGQVHGDHLEEVGPANAGRGFQGPGDVLSGADGLFTLSRGVPVAVATADCVPVIIASQAAEMIAVVHAGWRGTAAGILDRALDRFSAPRTQPDQVFIAIGPAAGGCCYEVGREVVEAVAAATGPSGPVTGERNGRRTLDLVATIAGMAADRGYQNVEVAGLCTIHERTASAGPDLGPDGESHDGDSLDYRFFSHRRQGPCGRQFAIGMRR